MKGFFIIVLVLVSILFGIIMTVDMKPASNSMVTVQSISPDQNRYFLKNKSISIDLPEKYSLDPVEYKDVLFAATSSDISLNIAQLSFDYLKNSTYTQESYVDNLLKGMKNDPNQGRFEKSDGSITQVGNLGKIKLGDNYFVVHSVLQDFVDPYANSRYQFYIWEYYTKCGDSMCVILFRGKVPIDSRVSEFNAIVSTMHLDN